MLPARLAELPAAARPLLEGRAPRPMAYISSAAPSATCSWRRPARSGPRRRRSNWSRSRPTGWAPPARAPRRFDTCHGCVFDGGSALRPGEGARRESYARPGALPTVQRQATIDQDLRPARFHGPTPWPSANRRRPPQGELKSPDLTALEDLRSGSTAGAPRHQLASTIRLDCYGWPATRARLRLRRRAEHVRAG